ncbi:MAG TPA: pilus assembly protein TadG-related protein [Caulobacteraceae bacterium]|jgi:Flp pilus assembly protein TadG
MLTARHLLARVRRFASRFRADERGLIALKFALGLPAVALLAVGAIDLTEVHNSKGRLQDIADAAALAGAPELSLATDGSGAIERATAYVQSHLSEWAQKPEVTPEVTMVTIGAQRAIRVRLAAHRDSFFGNMLPPGGWNFSTEATATSVGLVPLCVLVTGSTRDKLLEIEDGGRITAPSCLVHSNRDILVKSGKTGSITAGMVQAVTTASGSISPAPGTGAQSIDDPFAQLGITPETCPPTAPKVDVKSGVHRVAPGIHCGAFKMAGNAELILEPGEHWFVGGSLEIKEDARLTGADVVLFFDRDSKFEFKDRSTVNLEGRETGSFAGMVMVATRDNTNDFLIFSDNVESLLGVIYVPNAKLIVDGKEDVARDSAWTVIVAEELRLKGSPSLYINANYGASDVPVPDGVGPRTSGSQLVR